jgi:hypothetical protein
MTDVSFDIVAGTDDGNARADGTLWNNTGSEITLGNFSGILYHAFFRFASVNIPDTAVIDSAIIRLSSGVGQSGNTVNLNVYFEAADDPAAPTTGADLVGRSLGDAIAWNSVAAWSTGVAYDSPDLTEELQAVIDRGGWNSGQAVTCHIIDNGSSSSARRNAASYENSSYAEAQLIVSYHLPNQITESEAVEITESVSIESDLIREENISIQEGIEALLGFDESLPLISQGVAVSEFVAFELEFTGEVEKSEDIGLSIYRNVELEGPKISVVENLITISETVLMVPIAIASDGIGITEEITVKRGYDVFASDSFDFADTFEAFNYSAWLKANLSVAKLRFFCTITGAADLQADVEIPIRSFYARKKSGDPSYLQVVVPGFGYAAAVANRPNGDLILEVGYEVDGVVSLREQISVVDIDDISIAEGGLNRSITVAGHRTITYGKNYIEIARKLATYHALQKNVLSYRFAYIDPYLNPGDTLVVGETAMTVNNVIYIVDPLRSTMQVSEA